MTTSRESAIPDNKARASVRHEIRGRLAHSADMLEKPGNGVLSENIGNTGPYGFRALVTMRSSLIDSLFEPTW